MIPTCFNNSPISSKIYTFFQEKYGNGMAGLIRALTIYSRTISSCPSFINFGLLLIAPSGHFKTQMNRDVMKMFAKNKVVYLGSDITIHSMIREYNKGKDLEDKTAIINDLVLLFSTKSARTKERLTSGFAELLSDGKYIYGERLRNESIECNMNLIANITPEAYKYNKFNFIENTFGERLFPFFYSIAPDEMSKFNKERDKRFNMKNTIKIKWNKMKEMEVEENVKKQLLELAEQYRISMLSPSVTRIYDKLLILGITHAHLNHRVKIDQNDINFLVFLQKYTENPTNLEVQIAKLLHNDTKIHEIQEILNLSSRGYIYKIKEKLELRGVLQKMS